MSAPAPLPPYRPPLPPYPPPPPRPPRAYRLLFGLAVPLGVVALALWYATFSTAEILGGNADRLLHWSLVCGVLSGLFWIAGTFAWFAADG